MTAHAFVAAQLPKHSHVESVDEDEHATLFVTRTGDLSVVRIAVTDEEWLGPEDVDAVLARGSIDAIVNPGRNRHYLGSAKVRALNAGVAVLTFRELLSALGEERLTDYKSSDMEYVLRSLPAHRRVAAVEQLCERQVRVHRTGLPTVDIVVVGIYTLGVADVVRILGEHSETDAILNLGDYREYTPDAKERATLSGVGLFGYRELFGALNHEGDNFIHYRAPAGGQ